MKRATNTFVRIPQLHYKKRKIYEEDDAQYINIDGDWWGLDGYKSYLKDRYGINITYEFHYDS